MSDPCPDCPCPSICLKWPIFCEWAESGDAVQRRHICGRSAMRPEFVPADSLLPSPEEADRIIAEIERSMHDPGARRGGCCG